MAANSEQVLVALMQIRSHITYSELGSELRAGVSCSNAKIWSHVTNSELGSEVRAGVTVVALMQIQSHVTYSELGSELRAGVSCSQGWALRSFVFGAQCSFAFF